MRSDPQANVANGNLQAIVACCVGSRRGSRTGSVYRHDGRARNGRRSLITQPAKRNVSGARTMPSTTPVAMGTDCGGPDAVAEGEAGWLVQPGSTTSVRAFRINPTRVILDSITWMAKCAQAVEGARARSYLCLAMVLFVCSGSGLIGRATATKSRRHQTGRKAGHQRCDQAFVIVDAAASGVL